MRDLLIGSFCSLLAVSSIPLVWMGTYLEDHSPSAFILLNVASVIVTVLVGFCLVCMFYAMRQHFGKYPNIKDEVYQKYISGYDYYLG